VSVKPLKKLGAWRAQEGAFEITVPLIVTALAWNFAHSALSEPSVGRAFSTLELAIILGGCTAVTSWMASRQMYLLRKRAVWTMMFLGWFYTIGILLYLPGAVRSSFGSACEDLSGLRVTSSDLTSPELLGEDGGGGLVCQIGGVPGNQYLPGAILRPSWDGAVPPHLWAFFLLISGVASLSMRDRRIRPSKMGAKLNDLLRFGAPLGHGSAGGKIKAKGGKIVACNNATFWGELCGQIYSADKPWLPGEWCVRCGQSFRRCDRTFTFKVVTLFTTDVDVLNSIERTDTVSWDRGDPMVPDARISGMERWVTLGTVTVPDVIAVNQMLAITKDMLKIWGGAGDARVAKACKLTTRKMSAISAWIWFGSLAHRLTYARPTQRALLAIGTTRLRDILPDGGEELWLQLDCGLLPIEVRTGFVKTTPRGGRTSAGQNSKVDIWIPVSAPRVAKAKAGLWVPRIEGDALRTWLSTERLQDESNAGSQSIPLPYLRYTPDGGDPWNERLPRPGTLDLVRFPLAKNGMEPATERSIGDSIAEWRWLEWEQIELLRKQCLVLVEDRGRHG